VSTFCVCALRFCSGLRVSLSFLFFPLAPLRRPAFFAAYSFLLGSLAVCVVSPSTMTGALSLDSPRLFFVFFGLGSFWILCLSCFSYSSIFSNSWVAWWPSSIISVRWVGRLFLLLLMAFGLGQCFGCVLWFAFCTSRGHTFGTASGKG